MSQYHQDLVDHGVKVGVVMAFGNRDNNGIQTGPAVKNFGRPVYSKTKIVSTRDRVHMAYDALVILDGDAWKDMNDKRKLALLDHELTRLAPALGEETDDLGRPRLQIIPCDYVLAGFSEVARRHGEFAVEVREARQLQEDFGQYLFNFGDPAPVDSERSAFDLTKDKKFVQAAAKLCPTDKDGTVELSMTGPDGKRIGEKVTLTSETGKKLRKMAAGM